MEGQLPAQPLCAMHHIRAIFSPFLPVPISAELGGGGRENKPESRHEMAFPPSGSGQGCRSTSSNLWKQAMAVNLPTVS